MKIEHVEAIYKAKRTLLRNKAKIIDLKRRQEHDKAARLLAVNKKLQRDIRIRFGIILDD